ITLSASLHSVPMLLSCNPPASPSFPTRRSSDLRKSIKSGVADATERRKGNGRAFPGEHDPGQRIAWFESEIRLVYNAFDKSDVRDRKITRLNSSHVKISYAVFCLKKKRAYENTT